MSNKYKIIKLEKKKKDLTSNIQICHYYKQKITEFVSELNSNYESGLISKEYYKKQLYSTFKGRTQEQWLNYYDELIMYYQYTLNICKREIKKEKAKIIPPTLFLVILLILGAVLFFLGPGITGFSIYENTEVLIDNSSVIENLPLKNTEVTFDRSVDCHKCGQHKVPSEVLVNISIIVIAPEQITNIIDYYPIEWEITDNSEGVVSNHNITHNKIEWIGNYTNNEERNYIIKSPLVTTPTTSYSFVTEVKYQNITMSSLPWNIVVADASYYISSLTIDQPILDPDIDVGSSFNFQCTAVVGGSGGPDKNVNAQFEYCTGAGCNSGWTIMSSNGAGLYDTASAGTEPLGNLNMNTQTSVHPIRGEQANTYNIRCGAKGDGDAVMIYSSSQQVTVNAAVNNDYPSLFNAQVNNSLEGLNEFVHFNVSITDASHNIDYVNGTINGITYDFIQGAGDEWYYDWQCTSSDLMVDFTYAGANDTGTPSNWNDTIISNVQTECDAVAPAITGAEINDTSNVDYGSILKINASVVDIEDNLDKVILEIIPPVSAAYNSTPQQSGNEFYNDSLVLNEEGQWQLRQKDLISRK